MKKVSANVKKILTELMKSVDGLEAFSLFKRSGLTFNEFNKSFNHASSDGLVYLYDEATQKIKLTESGVSVVIKSTRNKSGELPWRTIPSEMKATTIEPHQPYVPNVYLLDKTFSSH